MSNVLSKVKSLLLDDVVFLFSMSMLSAVEVVHGIYIGKPVTNDSFPIWFSAYLILKNMKKV